MKLHAQTVRLGILFVLLLLPYITIASYSYHTSVDELTTQALERRDGLASVIAKSVDERLTGFVDLGAALVTGAVFEKLVADGHFAEALEHFSFVPRIVPEIGRVWIVDRFGAKQADSQITPTSRDQTWSTTDWFQAVQRSHEPYVSSVYQSPIESDHMVVAVAVPVFQQVHPTELLGIVVLEIRTENLLHWINQISLGPTGFAFITDQRGSVVVSSAPGQPSHESEVVQSSVFVHQPVPLHGWTVVVGQSTQAAFSSRHAHLVNLWIVYGLLFVLNLLFAVLVIRSILRLRAIDQAKTEFVSIASHQLRTPLTAVNWYTEMLLDGDAGPIPHEQIKYLQEIYTGNQRMVALVNALLNVSRLELGTFTVEPQPTDVGALLRTLIHEQELPLRDKHADIHLTCQKALPLLIADPKLLTIIFQNLISNAVKYSRDLGQIHIVIKLDANNARLIFSITDTGFGIPLEQQHQMFTKFFRADNVKEQDTEGSGLGLYIVKSVIDQCGGTIRFTSKLNAGTTFHVTLPIAGLKQSKKGSRSLSTNNIRERTT